jgi:hypothetical protein
MLEIAKNKMETRCFFPLKKLKLLNRKINIQKLDKATRQQTAVVTYNSSNSKHSKGKKARKYFIWEVSYQQIDLTNKSNQFKSMSI